MGIVKGFGLLAAAATLLAGCSSSASGGPGGPPSSSSPPAVTSSAPAPAPSTTDSDDEAIRESFQHLSLGDSLPLTSGEGADKSTYSVSVNKVLGASGVRGSTDRYAGLSITVSDVVGSPDYQSVQFGLQPASESSGDGGPENGQYERLNTAACKGLGMLDTKLDAAGADDDGLADLTLADGMPDVTGCVVVNYDAAEHPNQAVFADEDASMGTDAKVLARWAIKLPAPKQLAKPKPPKITLRITGNGSESGVITYTEGTSIEQATNASIPWTKKVSPNFDFYELSAQDDDGTSITCEIIDTDGTVLDKHTSTGLYAIASCSSSS